jgi:hypothetical protein
MTIRIESELAAQWLMAWFLERYEDPVEACPYESPEGYVYIWGGPYDAVEVLSDTWAGIFTARFLEQVADRLETEHDCYEWSAVPDEEVAPAGAGMRCRILLYTRCLTCDVNVVVDVPAVGTPLCWQCGNELGGLNLTLRGEAVSDAEPERETHEPC